jgi:hypothetical protein
MGQKIIEGHDNALEHGAHEREPPDARERDDGRGVATNRSGKTNAARLTTSTLTLLREVDLARRLAAASLA